ncbi:MAG: PEP-utilizing enzyme [Acidimicrobiia bacterium]
MSGTPRSHIGIVSRELEIPCVVGTQLSEEVPDGSEVEIDCSGDAGVLRVLT